MCGFKGGGRVRCCGGLFALWVIMELVGTQRVKVVMQRINDYNTSKQPHEQRLSFQASGFSFGG